MCGILGIFGIRGQYESVRRLAVKLSNRMKHRGPDNFGLEIIEVEKGVYNILCHERLSIVDLSQHGRQPFISKFQDKTVYFAANGEIFNGPKLREQYQKDFPFVSDSDCEVIGNLYHSEGITFLNKLEGMFGIIIYDPTVKRYFIARDQVGIIPVYWGIGENGAVFASSEMKVIEDYCKVEILLPGQYVSNEKVPVQWYNAQWHDIDHIPTKKCDFEELRQQLIKAVEDQLIGDAPFGLLISGGVDSSLIAAIAVRLVKEGKIDLKKRGMTKIHSFCVGLKGSPDLAASQEVADYLGTEHHPFEYTVEEGIDYIPEVVYHTETYNNTTIRASTPMFILARKIKALGIKYCLTGEGADELFGGYLYFHKAPNEVEFHRECVRKVKDLYKYDLLRANKSTMAWGLEVRPPFLHKEFMEYALALEPSQKVPKLQKINIEKYILRAAFDSETDPYIPKSVLWRQKEQFSDGVGYQWRDGIHDYCDRVVSDELYSKKAEIFPIHTPMNKEQFFYRQIFQEHYPSESGIKTVPMQLSIACSTQAALEWDESFKTNTDESGRAVLGIHTQGENLKGTFHHNLANDNDKQKNDNLS